MLLIKKFLGELYYKFGTNIMTLVLSKALDILVAKEQKNRLKSLQLNGGKYEQSKSV